jgi:hypothetical protein
MAGIIITPMERAVAILEPQIAAKIMLEITHTIARPPVNEPTTALAASTRYLAVPPLTINVAAITKKGTAIRGKLARELYMTSGTNKRGVPEKNASIITAVIPITKATGRPVTSNRRKKITKNMIIGSHFILSDVFEGTLWGQTEK